MKRLIFKKAISLVLCLAILLPMIPIISLPARAEEIQSTTQNHTESTYLDGVHYYINKSISYLGNRSYQLNVQLSTTLTDTDIVLNRNYARNGYLTVGITGWYLLELWGGEGADGDDVRDFIVTRPGGEGGDSGYVYAKVYLEAGQTLAYSIGTDGLQTYSSGTGGGVNGSGGDRGDGSKAVGAGGGYSALYFFNEGEFDPSWLQANGTWSFPYSVRTSNYVMIAAGGGGGGAGNGVGWVNATGANGIMLANGGAGGNINNGVSMTLSGAGGSVAGYLFFGRNGQSSGTSTAYVGRGGTNVPGACPSTSGGAYTAEPGPNDWSGFYNTDVTAGAGGMGMFRGGGGGAGFTGGSGGIMYAQAITNQVGGGGGGSSFLASSIGGVEVEFGSTVDDDKLLGAGGCPSNEGGAFSYTYLGNDGDVEVDTSYLTDVTVQGQLSQYFDVYANPTTTGTSTPNGEIFYDSESGSFTVVDASIDASSVDRGGVILNLSFFLKAKSAFVGGNNVPVLESLSITMDRGSSEPTVIESEGEARTDNVNVPLALSIPTSSKMISLKEGESGPTFNIAELYTNEHTEANKNTATAGWAYDFVSAVASPVIYTGNQGTAGSKYSSATTPEITETTYYSVTMKVTPKTADGYAACGPKSESAQTFVGIITLTVLDSTTIFDGDSGWSYDLTAKKTLSQQDDYFIFEEAITQSITRQYDLNTTASYSGSSDYSEATFAIQKTGYYLLQVWGGNGGKGQNSKVQTSGGTTTATGGSGGSGAAVYVFAYLEEGDTLYFTLGKNGTGYSTTATNPNSSSSCTQNLGVVGSPGAGGYASAIALQKNGATAEEITYVVIAGGGGGGSGSAAARGGESTWNNAKTTAHSGGSGSSTFNYTGGVPTVDGDLSAFKGSNGASASYNLGIVSENGLVSVSGGSPSAKGGDSYCDTVYANVGKSDAETLYLSRLAATLAASADFTKPSSSGSARVSFICDDETTHDLEQFPGVEAGGTFSRYFEIPRDENGVPMIDMSTSGVSYDRKETTVNDDGSITITYYEGELLSAQFSFTLTEENDLTTYHVFGTVYHPTFRVSEVDEDTYIADCGFSLLITLAPRKGFLGGNDVPVLDGLGGEYTNVYVTKNGQLGYLKSADKADYANVPVNYDVSSSFMVNEGYAVLGDGNAENDTVSITDLYTLNIDLSEYADWQKEFVRIQYPEQTADPLSYTLTSFTSQWVSLTAGLVPTTPADEAKAVVSGESTGELVSLYTYIYAQYPIVYNLSNVTATGPQYVTFGRSTSIYLSVGDGFLLPSTESVSVTNSYGNNLSFSYDEESGLIEIPTISYLYSPVTVTVTAKPLLFKLYYVFSIDGVNSQQIIEEYDAGEAIDPTFINTFFDTYGVEEKEGHTFVWEWETDDGLAPAVMPGHDLWVVGGYKKDLHTLTISYAYNGASVAPDYTAVLEYGSSFSVPTPSVTGYMPSSATINGATSDPFVISGVVGDEDISATVEYVGASGRLVILYLYPDGTEHSRIEREGLLDGEAFEFDSPVISGYVASSATVNGEVWNDPTRVTGNMPAGDSVLAQVWYEAAVYSVNLEYRYDGDTAYPKPDGATLSYDLSDARLDIPSDSISVVYGNIFGYNRDTDRYGMPTPTAPGYAFAGWYTDTTFTEEVTEDRIVTLDYPTTLYAKWEPQQYKLILRFTFVEGQYISPDISALPTGTVPGTDENGDGEPDYYYLSLDYYLDEEYDVDLNAMTGYTPYLEYGVSGAQTEINGVEGNMPAINRLYEITYEVNSYLIQFYAYGGLSHVTFPTYTSYMQEEGPFAEDQKLTEAIYEHAEPVIYPEPSPNQVREYYTFVLDYWESAEGVAYPADLVATEDDELYARYVAHENVATVYDSGAQTALSHHYLISDALETAAAQSNASYESSAPIVRLHRHEDVADKTISLSETVVFGNGATNSPIVRLDLAGVSLTAEDTAIEVKDVSLYLCNSALDTPASITVEQANDAIALLQTGSGALSVGSSISSYAGSLTVEAISSAGNAVGVNSVGYSCQLYQYGAGNIVATAHQGNAFGVLQDLKSLPHESIYCSDIYGSITVAAQGDAYAVKTNASSRLNSTAALSAESENGNAVGIEGAERLDVSYATKATVSAHSANGSAIGIYSTNRIIYDVDYTLGLTVEASADNADATAIIVNTIFSNYMYNVSATATAPNGKAIALKYITESGSGTIGASVTLRAEGREAVGLMSVGGSRLYATVVTNGTERSVAVYSLTGLTELGEGISILSESAAGNAYAIYGGTTQTYSYKLSNGGSVLAKTETGNAYALYNCSVTGNLLLVSVSAEAIDVGNAYALYVTEGVSCNLYNSSYSVDASAPLGTAYGAFVAGEATLYGAINATGKVAYGAYVSGKVTELGSTLAVTGEENAYGVAVIGGNVSRVTNAVTVTVDATAEDGASYGLYAAASGKIGNAPIAESIAVGVVSAAATGGGAGYALYAETGYIYVAGNPSGTPLYYKGSTDESRRYGSGVVIASGFVEALEDDSGSSYYGYYYLTIQGKYQIVFIGKDLDGNVLGEYGTLEYTLGVGFVSGTEPTAPESSDPGYTGVWEEFDFSAPADTPEVPDPDTVYTKYVYSTYERNKFTLYVYYQDDTWDSESFEVTYLDTVLPLLQMGTREKTGHTFNGVWTYNGEQITAEWTMPASSTTIYAKWDKQSYTVTFMTGGVELSFNNVETLEQTAEKTVIRGEYQTGFDYSYVVPGYTLEGFYTDSAFTQKLQSYSIPYVEDGEEFIIYVRWIESLSVVIMGPLQSYQVMLNAWMDANGNEKIDADEAFSIGTLEELYGAEEGELLLNPTADNPFGMLDVSPVWLQTYLPEGSLGEGSAAVRVISWCAEDARPINLASGVGGWGIEPDENGLTHVYARIGEAPENAGVVNDVWTTVLNGNSETAMGSLLTRDDIFFGRRFDVAYLFANAAAQDGSELGGYTYNYYKALTTGEQIFYLLEIGTEGFYTQYEITLCKQDGSIETVVDGEAGKFAHNKLTSLEDDSKVVKLSVDMEAGDTLLFKSNQLSNENGEYDTNCYAYAFISMGIPDSMYDTMGDVENVLQFYLITHCATDFFFYARSMGEIELPTDRTSLNPAYDEVIGWAVSDENMQPTETVLTEINPGLLDDSSLWLDMDGMALLFLLPKIGEITGDGWLGAIIADRHFDPTELSVTQSSPPTVKVRGAAAVTLRFDAEMQTAGEVATLFFTSGLPKGSTLTLIDISEDTPVYYTYVVEDDNALITLSLSSFTLSGSEGTVSFSGCAEKMMLQICYPKETAPDSESISIGINESPSDIELSFETTETREIERDATEAEDNGYIEDTATLSALTGRGYGEDDIALLVLRLYDEQGVQVSLPAGFLTELTHLPLKTYPDFAYAALGRVGDLNGEITTTSKLHLSALRYLGFKGTVVYEIIVVPEGTDLSGASFGGAESTVDTRMCYDLTVKETPAITLNTNGITAARGEIITISATVDGLDESVEVDFFLLQRVKGELIRTDACAALLLRSEDGAAIEVDEDGGLVGEYGNEEYTFAISGSAEPGVYFIVVRYKDGYSVCALTVTE